jgi:hypothetical protein
MEKMKVQLSEPVTISEVVVDRIMINPEENVIRITLSVGAKRNTLTLSGEDYDAVIAEVNLDGIVSALQARLTEQASSMITE